jgi:hypothetical protein
VKHCYRPRSQVRSEGALNRKNGWQSAMEQLTQDLRYALRMLAGLTALSQPQY